MSINNEKVAVVILAAGLGTRMKSNTAKVLHKILDKSMILYVVEVAKKINWNNVILVVGNQAEKVKDAVLKKFEVIFAMQEKQHGTGHAVLCALPEIPPQVEEVVILCGDVPLLKFNTIKNLLNDHDTENRDITILTVEVDKPDGYGRVLFDENRSVSRIVEESDASEDQKKIKTINTGIYCIKKQLLSDFLLSIKSDNAQGEVYLTDIIEIGYKKRKKIGVMVCDDCDEFIGINTKNDLIMVENIMKKN